MIHRSKKGGGEVLWISELDAPLRVLSEHVGSRGGWLGLGLGLGLRPGLVSGGGGCANTSSGGDDVGSHVAAERAAVGEVARAELACVLHLHSRGEKPILR